MKSSTTIYGVVCATLFTLFVFFYIFVFQGNLLAFAQHVWSGGVTHYRPVISALVLTFCSFVLYFILAKTFRLNDYVKSLFYAPSLMLIATLTSVCPNNGDVVASVRTYVSMALVVISFIVIFKLSSSIRRYPKSLDVSICSNAALSNYCILLGLMLLTCGLGNTDRSLHDRLMVERCVYNNNYEGALSYKSIAQADSSMTMLYAYSLSKTGEMGERLFDYQLTGGSKALLPQSDKSCRFSFTNDSLFWHHLGGVPREWVYDRSTDFLQALVRQNMAKSAVEDYLLCSYLLDCDLDGFAKEVTKYYDFRTEEEKTVARDIVDKKRIKLAKKIGEKAAADSIPYPVLHNPVGGLVKEIGNMPKHYKEALTLYMHQSSSHYLSFKSSVSEADYEDYMKLLRKPSASKKEKEYELKSLYGGTYWYYYEKHKHLFRK